jgi:pilus assembly protein Flp/PilA
MSKFNEGRESQAMTELISKLKTAFAEFRSTVKREDGQGLVEYALILVLVSIVAIAALAALGTNVKNILQSVANHLA